MQKPQVILPGSTIGILGSGQLGRMLAMSARRMGYRVHVFSPEHDTPTGQVADVEVSASYHDLEAVRTFASEVDVVTFEFENIPFETTEAAAERAIVRPNGKVLHTTQHRVREKTFLRDNGFPVTPFAVIHSLADLQKSATDLGLPGVLKTAGWGYDGKGQIKLAPGDSLEKAWQKLSTKEAVLEAFVDFECEVSVIGARGLNGEFAHWGVIRNDHVNHILDLSWSPSGLDAKIENEAIDVARGILEKLNVVGVLCVEFFLGRNGKLMVNELAPRPHNSGHLTYDASLTSQFEQQLRAICGLPLGSTELLKPVAMANLLGDVWAKGQPDWAAALANPNVKIHHYGKLEARPGRKMGHLTAMANSAEEAKRAALEARAKLVRASV